MEEAQIRLTEALSREEHAAASRSNLRTNEGNGSAAETSNMGHLEQEIDDLTRRYNDLLTTEVPTDEYQQMTHFQAVSEIMSQLENAQLRLAEAQSSPTELQAPEQPTRSANVPPVPQQSQIVPQQSRTLQQQSRTVQQHSRTVQQQNRNVPHSPKQRGRARQDRRGRTRRGVFGWLATVVLGQGSSDRKNQNESDNIDPELLDYLGQRDESWPLPLGLSFPTQRMERQFELAQNELRQHLVAVQRELDDEYSGQRASLNAERDALEDEIASMRRDADAAEATAREEERLLQQRREERRQREEQARQERERVRMEQERQARAESEQIRRRNDEAERETLAAFSRLVGQSGNATSIGERGDIRMCRVCKAGPVVNMACSNLSTHNQRGCNRCRHCGHFEANWSRWLPWDGVTGPH